jgi:hypothetical protein
MGILLSLSILTHTQSPHCHLLFGHWSQQVTAVSWLKHQTLCIVSRSVSSILSLLWVCQWLGMQIFILPWEDGRVFSLMIHSANFLLYWVSWIDLFVFWIYFFPLWASPLICFVFHEPESHCFKYYSFILWFTIWLDSLLHYYFFFSNNLTILVFIFS